MRLHGSTEGSLIAALSSASRLRHQPVHADTIKHWSDLLHHARQELLLNTTFQVEALTPLMAELEVEVARGLHI